MFGDFMLMTQPALTGVLFRHNNHYIVIYIATCMHLASDYGGFVGVFRLVSFLVVYLFRIQYVIVAIRLFECTTNIIYRMTIIMVCVYCKV